MDFAVGIAIGRARGLREADETDESGGLKGDVDWMPEIARCGAREVETGRAKRFIFVGGVNEDHSGDFRAVAASENAHGKSGVGITGEDVWWGDAGAIEQRVKVVGEGGGGSREWTGVAPAHSGTVIPASLGESGDFGLCGLKLEADAAGGLENDGGSARSGAEEIERTAADVVRRTNLWEAGAITSAAELFVEDARNEDQRCQNC